MNILKNHYHILQFPKDTEIDQSSVLIDNFLTEILDDLSEDTYMDEKSRTFYKAFMFQHTECVATNTQFNFIFHEKVLDKLN